MEIEPIAALCLVEAVVSFQTRAFDHDPCPAFAFAAETGAEALLAIAASDSWHSHSVRVQKVAADLLDVSTD